MCIKKKGKYNCQEEGRMLNQVTLGNKSGIFALLCCFPTAEFFKKMVLINMVCNKLELPLPEVATVCHCEDNLSKENNIGAKD